MGKIRVFQHECMDQGKHTEREREWGYVSPKTGTISSGGREEGRRKAGERVESKRDRARCVERV